MDTEWNVGEFAISLRVQLQSSEQPFVVRFLTTIREPPHLLRSLASFREHCSTFPVINYTWGLLEGTSSALAEVC